MVCQRCRQVRGISICTWKRLQVSTVDMFHKATWLSDPSSSPSRYESIQGYVSLLGFERAFTVAFIPSTKASLGYSSK
ncbi:hypothetical protein COCC4DRAFT_33139 [Bipolaris maydis ATCC 48331]|uniref:Uncharacterized protein n=2 Tax=Cochliobolus heterostrophus TaxID=5016 RepID=M2UFD4_COCH5|nr:uncharacterized protein COCC4DRAFT_33139 [Bipolaris maydis ATCC 48331]EMD86632.1 hypothetical protein COCHEDRAFT_1023841 [Bipolaris maydis C5]ENI03029.1 hypothetical protein COCC4DRAFT_33139 [Bipolaris maydis ATCC 48331]